MLLAPPHMGMSTRQVQVPPALVEAASKSRNAKALARLILADDALLGEALASPAGLDAARWAAQHDPDHLLEQVAALVAQTVVAQMAGAPAQPVPLRPPTHASARAATSASRDRAREGYGRGWQRVKADLGRRAEGLSEADRERAGEHAGQAVHDALDEFEARCAWRPRPAAEGALATAARLLVPASLQWLDNSYRFHPDLRSERMAGTYSALVSEALPDAPRASRNAALTLVLGPTDRNRLRNAHPGFLPTWLSRGHGWDAMTPAEFGNHANYWLLLLCQVDQRRLSDRHRRVLVWRLGHPDFVRPLQSRPAFVSPSPSPRLFGEQMSLVPDPTNNELEAICV